MGIIKAVLHKIATGSAQHLGVLAVASLSVMTVSFSAIAYEGYKDSFKTVKTIPLHENKTKSRAPYLDFQELLFEEQDRGDRLVYYGDGTEISEEEGAEEKLASDSEMLPVVELNSSEAESETETESTEESQTEAETPPETSSIAETETLAIIDLNTPQTAQEAAEDAQKTSTLPVKSDPFENYYGTSTFNDYNVYLDTALGPMPYYNQHDSHWASYLYGGQDSISKYGCGPTTAAMIVSAFGNVNGSITPKEMSNWSAAYGYFAPKSGSYHDYIPAVLSAFDLVVDSVQDRSPANIANLLNNGHILVALMGKGALTNGGHFIIITKQNANGSISIADPNSYPNSQKDWDPAQIMRELKQNYDAGGPLWSVRIPGR
ncbi:C39 family peptidase [Oribacterium parvum]|uniref:C39 family peptidase n=1 Tax=Oribacterium parvum TaxID=1501329 RepID=UPI0028E875B1|nr:C39 family peptidase [Oribacterium parvum]